MGPRFFFELFLPSKYCCNWARLASVDLIPTPLCCRTFFTQIMQQQQQKTYIKLRISTSRGQTSISSPGCRCSRLRGYVKSDRWERERDGHGVGGGHEHHDASVLLLQHCSAAAVCTCNARTLSSVVFINGPRERHPPRGRSLNSTPARAPRFSYDRGRFAQHSRALPGSPTTVVWSLNTRAWAPRFSNASAPPDDWLPATPVAAPVPPTDSFLLLAIYSQIAKSNFIFLNFNYIKTAKIKCFFQFIDGQNFTKILRKITRFLYIVQVVAKNIKG